MMRRISHVTLSPVLPEELQHNTSMPKDEVWWRVDKYNIVFTLTRIITDYDNNVLDIVGWCMYGSIRVTMSMDTSTD